MFNSLGLIEPIAKALHDTGYTTPTPVQLRAIPVVLQERDLLGCAQTGTGKTAAFAIPLLQLLQLQKQRGNQPNVQALILTPTRELAIQVAESFETYGKYLAIKHLAIFGGVPQRSQVNELRKGTDVVIATPGRLLDLLNQGHLTLRNIKFFVLDEADRMLDMGFIHDVKRIIARLPAHRQTLFFSATIPPEIQRLSASLLREPVKLTIAPESVTADLIQQSLYYVEKHNKRSLLIHLLKDASIETALVFARTKHGADHITKDLKKAGIRAEAIHGNKSQNARQDALQNFKSRKTRILVATDIAARGVDIDDMTHVINYELPNIPETYIHRIGRTGRAGAKGTAISFCGYEEKIFLRDIQKLINKVIPVVKGHPFDTPLMHGSEQLVQSNPSVFGARRKGAGRRKVFFQQRA